MTLLHLFNFGGPDLIIILLIVLLLFGAKKLPPQGRGTGKTIGQFREDGREEAGSEKGRASPTVILNRLLIPIAIIIFLMACGVWFFGNGR